ncbi:MAG TPA: IS200/IS605 family transposase [Chloroflexi bacterium]|nr:IS200/IS605 family transposase [Chloroflexota bacterium]
MPLWRLYYHIVWATKNRFPLIEAEIEPRLYGYIIGKADALGCITHAIGGIDDHIHLVVSIPPSLLIADFVKNIKGSSSDHMNHSPSRGETRFGWQRGYGVFSFSETQVDQGISYVLHQKVHHRDGTIIPALERYTDEDDGPVLRKPRNEFGSEGAE